MKQTKFFMLAIAVIALIFASCGEKKGEGDKEEGGNKLDGKWKVVKAEGEMADLNVGTEYIFEDGKKLTTKAGIMETKGEITKSDDKTFSVLFEGLSQEFVYNYKFEGEQLIIELQNSGGQKFFLEKQ